MSALHEIAGAFRASLAGHGELSVWPVDALDRTGVPVVQASLIQPGKPIITGHGYGFEPIEAEVGALGELCEEAQNARFLADVKRTHGSYCDLVRRIGPRAIVDPLTLCLPAGSTYEPAMTLAWIEARRWPDGEPVLVPDEWVAAHAYDLTERAGLITPITNGLGAGFDLEHAIAHGVMELLQRDGNVVDYRALDRGAVVELDAIGDPSVRLLLAHLDGLGIAPMVKLAATEFGIANLYVVGDDPAPGLPLQVTACGEAAHPDRNRALRKALLEFCGSRVRKSATHGPLGECRRVMSDAHVASGLARVHLEEEESRALDAMVEWLGRDAETLRDRLAGTVLSDHSRTAFSTLPDTGPGPVAASADRLRLLHERLSSAGLDILFVECTPPDSIVRAVKTVIPFLECETMSYGRIGWRAVDRLRRRSDPLVIAHSRENARRVRLRPEDEERAGGPAWFDTSLASSIVGPLYPLYREPGCFAAQTVRQKKEEP